MIIQRHLIKSTVTLKPFATCVYSLEKKKEQNCIFITIKKLSKIIPSRKFFLNTMDFQCSELLNNIIIQKIKDATLNITIDLIFSKEVPDSALRLIGIRGSNTTVKSIGWQSFQMVPQNTCKVSSIPHTFSSRLYFYWGYSNF